MTQKNEYLDWLCGLVQYDSNNALIQSLYYSVNYIPYYERDWNRYQDGIDLRCEFDRNYNVMASENYHDHCSMLEMMVAFAVRINNDILWDGEQDYSNSLFTHMLVSLGLYEYLDDPEPAAIVIVAVDRFLNNCYLPNGKGGLFYVPDTDSDLTTMELWYQMHEYIGSL